MATAILFVIGVIDAGDSPLAARWCRLSAMASARCIVDSGAVAQAAAQDIEIDRNVSRRHAELAVQHKLVDGADPTPTDVISRIQIHDFSSCVYLDSPQKHRKILCSNIALTKHR